LRERWKLLEAEPCIAKVLSSILPFSMNSW
jgi:hypothetical protein